MAKRLRKPLVSCFRYQLDRRTPMPPRDPQRRGEHQHGNREVLPGIECPLAVPGELHRVGERFEVGDWPLVAVGAAGADEVTQQMQVEAYEHQERGESGVRGDAAG